MNTPLTYENKWDRENKPIPPALVKSYGVMVFALGCVYLWKLHRCNKAAIWQGDMVAFVTVLAVSLVANFGMKTAKTRAFLLFYQLAAILAKAIFALP
jgi:hypothetical protein